MKIPKHITRPYNIFLNNVYLHKIFRNHIQRSYARFFLEDLRAKYKNFRRKKPLDFFQSVLIETTPLCNRKCWYCPNTKFKRPYKLMSKKLFYKIINELSDMDYKGIICPHFFNEPLMDKRLEEFISYTRKKIPQSRILLYTNGDLLTKDMFLKLINAGVNIFEITEHGNEPSRITEKLFKFLEENPKYKKYVNYRKNLYLESRAGLMSIKEKRKKRCTSSLYNLTVNYRGEAVLCCQDYFAKAVFGNANKESLVNIWNKKHYKKIRESNKKGVFVHPLCRECAGIK